jgi:NAD+ synthase
MKTARMFNPDVLKIQDVESYIDSLCQKIKTDVHQKLRRKGGVIGISGGIDSSVTLALAVRALGKDQVIGLMLPEKDSSSDSLEYARILADRFGIRYHIEEITGALDGFKCYQRRDEAVKSLFPDYNPHIHTFKIGLNESSIETNLPSVFYITLVRENGREERKKLPAPAMMQIIAASNFKQRTRMCMLYYYAEKNHFAVVGTSNKQEIHQGFFVKHGDGGVDIMPIGHLYKTQVYQLAKALDVPREILQRTPTTDTYSAEQTQEEFFFQLPFREMDLLWYGYENGYPAEAISETVGKSSETIQKIFNSFKRKQQTTEYLRMKASLYDMAHEKAEQH